MYGKLRLGIVPYLNVLPLLEGLDQDVPRLNWARATPRQLVDLLENQKVDFATLPIFEVIHSNNYKLLGKCSISCDGPVRSVRLFSKKPFPEVKKVLLDVSSLTSVHLCQILCKEYLLIDPEFETSEEPIKLDFNLADSDYDAVLVIGDVAFEWEGTFEYELDLGAAWKDHTGLPFVFAGWVCHKSQSITNELQDIFVRARKEGERNVYDIAKNTVGLHKRELHDLIEYLSVNIKFSLREDQIRGIDLYRKKLIEHGFVPEDTQPIQIDSPLTELKHKKKLKVS